MIEKFLNQDRTAELWQSVKNYTIPSKSLTKDEYNALSEEEKMADVEYIITDDNGDGGYVSGITIEQVNEVINAAISSIPTIEEYNTDYGWHVRKHSNGYVEMSLIDVREVEINRSVGSLYIIKQGTHYYFSYPVPLIKKYSENIIISPISSTDNMFTQLTYDANPMIHTPQIYPASHIARTAQNIRTYIFVTGRWK